MKALLILFVSLLVLTVGCSENKPAKVNEDESFSNMVDSQAKAMQKAKALDGVLRDADKKRREEMNQ